MRTLAVAIGAVQRQTVRHWVAATTRGLAGLIDGKAPGRRELLDSE